MPSVSEVLVLLDQDDEECPRCVWCGMAAFAVHSCFYTTATHYYFCADVECAQGHISRMVEPPQLLDSEMRELLT